MHVKNKKWNEVWKCEMKNVMIMRKILSAPWSWQEFNEFLSADSDTLYDKHKIKTSWADERIEDEGYMEWIMNDKQVKSIEKKIVRDENENEKNENESEDGVVEHSKVQKLESRKICHKCWA